MTSGTKLSYDSHPSRYWEVWEVWAICCLELRQGGAARLPTLAACRPKFDLAAWRESGPGGIPPSEKKKKEIVVTGNEYNTLTLVTENGNFSASCPSSPSVKNTNEYNEPK